MFLVISDINYGRNKFVTHEIWGLCQWKVCGLVFGQTIGVFINEKKQSQCINVLM